MFLITIKKIGQDFKISSRKLGLFYFLWHTSPMEKSIDRTLMNKNCAILIPTLNRPDFVIRQLNYYASLNCPYTLYYADSSNQENAERIKNEIKKLENKLDVVYLPSPAGDVMKSFVQLISSAKEKYVTFLGDDDYWVPDTLNECVEFLEKNPDYKAAAGKAITFKTEDNTAFSRIKKIHDYPRYSIEDNTALERLFNYLGPKSSVGSILVSVLRKDQLLETYEKTLVIKDYPIRSEVLINALIIIAGKYKILDRLGFAHQLHDRHIYDGGNAPSGDFYDWFTNENWSSSYNILKDRVVAALVAKDNTSEEKARQVFKKSMWFYFNQCLRGSYNRYVDTLNPPQPTKKSLRTKIATRLPFLKKLYNKFVVPRLEKDKLSYKVINSNSKYHKDFKPVVESLTKKY